MAGGRGRGDDYARAAPADGRVCGKEPAEGAEQDLFAKALALQDGEGHRVVILTADLIGIIDRLREDVARRVEEQYRLPPHALLMNASHTHCGPAYGRADAEDYFDQLADTLVALVGQALDRLAPPRSRTATPAAASR